MTRAFADYPFSAERHPPRLPPLQQGREARRHPVVVVGGGPVGLCAAIGLALHRVPLVLLEADDSVCFGSRAICISRRSLEILERLGALDGFLRIGLPWTGGRSFYREREVLHFTMPVDAHQKLPPMVNLAQYHIEQILLERAQALGEWIDIRWQTRLDRVETGPDGVGLSLSTPAGAYAMQADWLVAADGGRSSVREQLGLRLQGITYEGRYVIVDIRLASDRPTERLAYFDPPCNPGSTVLVHKQPDGVWRIDYQLRDGEDPEAAIRPENVLPRVESLLAMMGETGDWQPVWIGLYKANALTLERYRHGRVLLAGDAAHLVPIFGVRGANSGIDDADNLAWKLAAVIQGRAGEALLDSYSDERVAAAHENLGHGTKSTEFMAPPSFAFALMREAVLGLAGDHPGVRPLINPRQTAPVSYPASPLNAPLEPADGDAASAGPAPGQVLPECRLMRRGPDGQPQAGHLTDLLHAPAAAPAFIAFAFSAAGETNQGLEAIEALQGRAIAQAAGLRVLRLAQRSPHGATRIDAWDGDGSLYARLGVAPGHVLLVRPDGHLLGRWWQPDAATLEAALVGGLGGGLGQGRLHGLARSLAHPLGHGPDPSAPPSSRPPQAT